MEQSWYNNLFHSISCSAPVEFAQNLLLSIHSAIGLPWWAVIMLSTISVKAFISLPLAVFQEHNKAKLKKAMLEINEKKIELRPEAIYAVTAQGLSKRQSQLIYRKKLRDEWTQILIKHNCHPAKNFILSIIQLPIWVILSVSIRNLCHMLPMHNESAYTTYMELKKGGFGWIQDLTEIDSLLLFPICAGIFNLLCLEMQLILNERKDTSLKFFMVNFSRIVIIIFTGVGMNISSAITMYWTTSSASSFLQNILLLSPKFRRLMGVPKMDSELQHPYLHLQKEINRKLNFVKRLTNLQATSRFLVNAVPIKGPIVKMKQLLLLVCAFLCVSAILADETYVLPYPGDCSRYQQCDPSGCFVMSCGIGTEFNPAINTCDYPLADRTSCSNRV
ncbi:hypothetical protein KM043_002180 [Ampulex compressa]|nr:hypothetical protein KM043_002180 [Ampulex compressa]